ncbi:MAG: cyclic pyranopterin monophosphate synthase MoaC [Chloroflexi bacterium]|nr:cyclic pyranopterin monophosphate synthase MoaC [Chloroflexota bacterium]
MKEGDPRIRARMVDVTEKPVTYRVAQAKGSVVMKSDTLELIRSGQVAKGDVLAVAQVAGIRAAKETPHLLPLCHPLLLTDVAVDLALNKELKAVEITATVKGEGKTGMEMEALTAIAVAALTIYDMCKPYDPQMRIEGIRLVKKSGGKSGTIDLEAGRPYS